MESEAPGFTTVNVQNYSGTPGSTYVLHSAHDEKFASARIDTLTLCTEYPALKGLLPL